MNPRRIRYRVVVKTTIALIIASFCLLSYYLLVKEMPSFLIREMLDKLDFTASEFQQTRTNPVSLWKLVDKHIGNSGDTLYPKGFDLDLVLHAMRTLKITKVDLFEPPTLKWILHLEGGQKVLFKPWLSPGYDDRATKDCRIGCEHPEYEVVSFMVSRLLDLRTMPYTVGREFSWERDLKPVASPEIKALIKEMKDGQICLSWKCRSYEKKQYCFHGGTINGSLMYWIDREFTEVQHTIELVAARAHAFYPEHRRLFGHYVPGDDTYCMKVRNTGLYSHDKHFLYMLDMAVFDFIVMALNSKHTYIAVQNSSLINVFVDRGKGFCKEMPLLLAPVYQCCRIRRTVYSHLLRLNQTFQEEFLDLARGDFYQPLVPPAVVASMQGRIRLILNFVNFCLSKYRADVILL